MKSLALVLIALLAILAIPIITQAQMQRLPEEISKVTIQELIKKEERFKRCESDLDCLGIVCPAVIGLDTPMCVNEKCICGPGRAVKYPINESKIASCLKIREKMKEILEEAREEKNMTRAQEKLNELARFKEEFKDCFPQPMPVAPIAIEAAVKKMKTVEEFREEMKKLKEEMLNNMTTQNLTGRQLAEIVKEYNEKRKELVKDFVGKIHEINMERMEEIKEVVVARHVKWENETLFNVTRIVVTVNGKNITIEPGDNVTISVGGVVVKSIIPLKVKNNTIEDADTNQTIRETPDRIKAKIREQIREMKLERKGNKPVYVVSAAKQGRLLGVIPINVSVNYEISATDGSTIEVNRPWWSFLVFG
jgi:antitoxin (DNA-binding transcriptional repressor) of toxin-antitoxin stability system